MIIWRLLIIKLQWQLFTYAKCLFIHSFEGRLNSYKHTYIFCGLFPTTIITFILIQSAWRLPEFTFLTLNEKNYMTISTYIIGDRETHYLIPFEDWSSSEEDSCQRLTGQKIYLGSRQYWKGKQVSVIYLGATLRERKKKRGSFISLWILGLQLVNSAGVFGMYIAMWFITS